MFYFVEVVIAKISSILAAVPVIKHIGDWNIIFTWVDNSGRRTKLLRMMLLWGSQPNSLWSCHEKIRQCTVFMNAIRKKIISFPELVKVKKKGLLKLSWSVMTSDGFCWISLLLKKYTRDLIYSFYNSKAIIHSKPTKYKGKIILWTVKPMNS